MNIKRFFKQLITMPWSPEGRKIRIEHLMESTGEERDICAAIIYLRDTLLHRNLSEDEMKDFERIGESLKKGEIILPVDR